MIAARDGTGAPVVRQALHEAYPQGAVTTWCGCDIRGIGLCMAESVYEGVGFRGRLLERSVSTETTIFLWELVCSLAGCARLARRAFGMDWRHLVGHAAQSECLLGVPKMQNAHAWTSVDDLCTVCVFFIDVAVAWTGVLPRARLFG